MSQQRRTDFTGPALIRLLARLTEAEPPGSQQAFADRLSQWLGWTDAISLSAALNGGGPAQATAPLADARPSPAHAEAAGECARVRAALSRSIAEDNLFAVAPPEPPKPQTRGRLLTRGEHHEAPPPPPPAADEGDFTPYRLRYQAKQMAMEAAIGPLREKLRARLATRSPSLVRLATLDGVMEQVLGEQERRLLGTLPATLEKHFMRLRKQHLLAQEEGQQQQATPPDAAPLSWLHRFGQDAQTMLQAELDIRFKPVEGLLEALRSQHAQVA